MTVELLLFQVAFIFLLQESAAWLVSFPLEESATPRFHGKNILVKYKTDDSHLSKLRAVFFKPHVSHREEGALVDLSFDLKGPGPIGLIGPSGSGKSTFFQLLQGKVEISKGSLTVQDGHGRDIQPIYVYVNDMFPVPSDSKAGPSLQAALADPPSHTGCEAPPAPSPSLLAEAYAQLVALTGLGPGDLAAPVRALSGGARFRYRLALALARAWAAAPEGAAAAAGAGPRPPVLLVDELLDRQDARVRRPVNLLLRRLAAERGVTVLLASHAMDDVLAACPGACLALWKGRAAYAGPPAGSGFLRARCAARGTPVPPGLFREHDAAAAAEAAAAEAAAAAGGASGRGGEGG